MKTTSLRLFALALLLPLVAPLHTGPVLAGHGGLKGTTLDAEGIKAVLLGKRVTLGDARVVIIIAKTSPAQDAFLQAHIAMTTSQFQNHWRRLFMTGGGSAPKVVDTEADAAKLAAETPGALVLIDSGQTGELAVLASD